MPKFYSADELKIAFSTTGADGRWITTFLTVASPYWSFTLHNLPLNPGIRIEINNSRSRPEGVEGFINPLVAGLQSSNSAVHKYFTTDPDFDNNWVIYKPENEFSLSAGAGSLSTMKFGIVSSDTGGWPIAGAVRFVRLSMTATPNSGTSATKAYYFDSAYY